MSIDLKDLMLEATAEVQETLREVMQELSEPGMTQGISQMWVSMPDEMKEQFKRDRPAEYAALMDVIGGKNGENIYE